MPLLITRISGYVTSKTTTLRAGEIMVTASTFFADLSVILRVLIIYLSLADNGFCVNISHHAVYHLFSPSSSFDLLITTLFFYLLFWQVFTLKFNRIRSEAVVTASLPLVIILRSTAYYTSYYTSYHLCSFHAVYYLVGISNWFFFCDAINSFLEFYFVTCIILWLLYSFFNLSYLLYC